MAQIGEYNLKQLNDSSLFYMRNPPKFTRYAALLIVAILLGVVIWSSTAIKAEQVENTGTVMDKSAIQISTEVSGSVIQVEVEEGDRVSEGDILFRMDTTQAMSERDSYMVQKERYTQRIQLIDRYIDSVTASAPNPFINSGDEQEFYLLRVAYDNELDQIYSTDAQTSIFQKYLGTLYNTRTQIKETVQVGDSYQEIIAQNERYITLWHKYGIAAQTRVSNPFNAETETEFYNMYQTFIWAFEEYEKKDDAQYAAQAYQLQNNQITQAVNSERNLTEQNKNNMTYVKKADMAKERSEYLETAITYMEAASSVNPFDPLSTNVYEAEYYKTYEAVLSEVSQQGIPQKIDAARDKQLNSIYNDRKNSSDQLLSQESNLAKADANLAKYSVRAASAGKVHLDMDLKEGVQLQQGSKIGSINGNSGMQIEMQVSAHDRARLTVGQECKFTVDGLLQSEYGHINGTIMSISEDVTVSEKQSFFKIIVQFSEDHLTDSHGNTVDIVDGMSVRVWTTYEKSTFLTYFLEKLGL